MSSTKEKLKMWFLIPTEMETQPEAVAETVMRAMERPARRAHRVCPEPQPGTGHLFSALKRPKSNL